MHDALPCVRVVDDDAAVLSSLDRLLRSAGYAVRTFASREAFLHERGWDAPGCVLMDLSLAGPGGLEFRNAPFPVVFMSGEEPPGGAQAMKALGAGFLSKPFDREELLAAVRAACQPTP